MPHCNDTYSGKYIFIILKYINQSEMFLQLARNHFAAWQFKEYSTHGRDYDIELSLR